MTNDEAVYALRWGLDPKDPSLQDKMDQIKKCYTNPPPSRPAGWSSYDQPDEVLVRAYGDQYRASRSEPGHEVIIEQLLPLLELPCIRTSLRFKLALACTMVSCADTRIDPLVTELVAEHKRAGALVTLFGAMSVTPTRIPLFDQEDFSCTDTGFLVRAIYLGESNIDAVKTLLDRGADSNILAVCDALSDAQSGPLLDLAVSRGFNLKRYGSRLIRRATGRWRGDQAFLDYLVNNGDLIKQFRPGTQTLKAAIRKREMALAALIIRALPPSKLTPSLEYACQKGNYEAVTMLLERGAPVNGRCLAMAFKMVEPRCLELMLNAGGDLDKINTSFIRDMVGRLPESRLRVKLETQLVASELTGN